MRSGVVGASILSPLLRRRFLVSVLLGWLWLTGLSERARLLFLWAGILLEYCVSCAERFGDGGSRMLIGGFEDEAGEIIEKKGCSSCRVENEKECAWLAG